MPPKVRITTQRRMPSVWVDFPVYRDMLDIAKATKSEVAWFGEVEKYDNEVYLITSVSVPEQQSNGSTVEMEPEDLERFALEYLEEHGTEAYNRLRLWGHSHHTMGVTPSSQDDNMVDALCSMVGDYFIAVRINHKGDIQADIAYNDGITISSCDLNIGLYDPERTKKWAEIVESRLRKITYTTVYSGKTGPTYGQNKWQQQHAKGQGGSGKASGGPGGAERVDANGDEWVWDHIGKTWTPYRLASPQAQRAADEKRYSLMTYGGAYADGDELDLEEEIEAAMQAQRGVYDESADFDWETDMTILACDHKYDTTEGITLCVNCGNMLDDILEVEKAWRINSPEEKEVVKQEATKALADFANEDGTEAAPA